MAQLWFRESETGERVEVTYDHPLPVSQAESTYLTYTHTAISVLVTDTLVLNPNTSRRYLLLVNDSANIIYIRFGTAAAVASQGIRLGAAGGSYEMTVQEGNLTTQAVHAIALTATSVLLVTEGVAS